MYYFSKTLTEDFDRVIEKVTAGLKSEGFGILSEIDMKSTLKNKLDVEFPPYRILAACNPPFALKALQAEVRIGTMLPCNVIVRELEDGSVEVVAVDPVASMQAVENPKVKEIAGQIGEKLQRVVTKL